MKAFLTGAALAALIAASSAFAEDQTQQVVPPQTQAGQSQDMQSAMPCPEGQAGAAPDNSNCPPQTTGALPDQKSGNSTAAETAKPQDQSTNMVAKADSKFIKEQDDKAFLASELIGQTVYDPTDKKLGDELAAAPEFKTTAAKVAELQSQQAMPAGGDAGGMAPAPDSAPAQ